jgi:hypothetical protein
MGEVRVAIAIPGDGMKQPTTNDHNAIPFYVQVSQKFALGAS